MHDSKAVSFSVLMAYAFNRPTTGGIDDVRRVLNGTEAIPQTVQDRVDNTAISHQWV